MRRKQMSRKERLGDSRSPSPAAGGGGTKPAARAAARADALECYRDPPHTQPRARARAPFTVVPGGHCCRAGTAFQTMCGFVFAGEHAPNGSAAAAFDVLALLVGLAVCALLLAALYVNDLDKIKTFVGCAPQAPPPAACAPRPRSATAQQGGAGG